MPVTYHYRPRSPDSIDELLHYPLESSPDDSIVLSDILRTGETSRLRRRGAMRIESSRPPLPHQYRLRSVQQAGSSPVNSLMQDFNWGSPRARFRHNSRHAPMLEVCDDSEDEFDPDSGDEITFSASFNQAISEQTGVRDSGAALANGDHISTEKASYTLVCGGLDDSAICERGTPETNYSSFLAASILPQPLHSRHSTSQGPMSAGGSNGCGAVIHTKTFPRYHHHRSIWSADTPPTDNVVPLDAAYFDDFCEREKLSVRLIGREGCGCFRIGVGCAQCGNRLGFRLRPCQKLKEGLYNRMQTQDLRSSSTPKSKQEEQIYLYTFFSTSSSSPEAATFPVVESTLRNRDSRPRSFPDTSILPPPPPMIRIMSDSDLSDSDEEITIDFRRSESISGPTRILGGSLTASPEPQTLDLDQTDVLSRTDMLSHLPDEVAQVSNNETLDGHAFQVSIETGTASRSNGNHGPERATPHGTDGSNTANRAPNVRVPVRRRALSPDAASFLGFISPTNPISPERIDTFAQNDHTESTSPFNEHSMPMPIPSTSSSRENEFSTLETSNDMATPTIWGMSIADGHPSTSFWGRPPEGTFWTWENASIGLNNEEGTSGRYDNTRPQFDPDGEFLEVLGREWGEDLAQELGLEEKSENGDAPRGESNGRYW